MESPTALLPVLTKAPENARILRRPPVVSVGENSVLYLCGACSTLLLRADPGTLRDLVIECRECGALNDAST